MQKIPVRVPRSRSTITTQGSMCVALLLEVLSHPFTIYPQVELITADGTQVIPRYDLFFVIHVSFIVHDLNFHRYAVPLPPSLSLSLSRLYLFAHHLFVSSIRVRCPCYATDHPARPRDRCGGSHSLTLLVPLSSFLFSHSDIPPSVRFPPSILYPSRCAAASQYYDPAFGLAFSLNLPSCIS